MHDVIRCHNSKMIQRHTHTYFSIIEGVDGPRRWGVGGASVGLLLTHLLRFTDWLHHFWSDCLCTIVMHRLCISKTLTYHQ